MPASVLYARLVVVAGSLALPTTALGSGAPDGLLTPFEQRRHAEFVQQARSRPSEVLFIGDSAVEFWLAEGKATWEVEFAGLPAANLGVQGADTRSVLWRLRNGEFEHARPKVIVLDALLAAGNPEDGPTSKADVIAGNDALVSEIRRLQPQAQILLLVVPRPRSLSLQAALRDHFARVADGDAVTFLDVTPVFTASDGRFDSAMGSGRGSALSARGYATLARALGPAIRDLLARG